MDADVVAPFLFSGAVLSIMFIMWLIHGVIWWRIFSRTGQPGALGLLMFIPVVGFIMMIVLAFGEWPVLRELMVLRNKASVPPTPPPHQVGGGV